MGDVVAAVDRYADIPPSVRARLKERIAARQYDEIATIKRDGITGEKARYGELRDMHFGQGTVCRQVSRTRWTPVTEERGLVYCEASHCIIVPTVCRNVSRVTRQPEQRTSVLDNEESPAAGSPLGPGLPIAVADAGGKSFAQSAGGPGTGGGESGELRFDPPGAGPSFVQGLGPSPEPLPPVIPSPGTSTASGGASGPAPGLPGTGAPPFGTGDPDGAPGAPPFGGGIGGGLPPGAHVPVPFAPLPSFGGATTLPGLPGGAPVAVVPEPETWALWLAGLGVLIGAVRRRRA